MGAWGTGPLESDTTLDWLADYDGAGAAAVREAFEAQKEQAGGEYIDSDVSECAWIAAEAVALAHGRPHTSMSTNPNAAPLQRHLDAVRAADLRDAAIEATTLMRADQSELRELWTEDDASDGNPWLTEIADLEARLKDAPA